MIVGWCNQTKQTFWALLPFCQWIKRKIVFLCLFRYTFLIQNIFEVTNSTFYLTSLTWLIYPHIGICVIFWPKNDGGKGFTIFLNSSMRNPFSSNSFYFIEKRSFVQNHKFSNKNNHLPVWREIGNIFFLPYALDLIHLLEQNFCLDSNLRVKKMYESVK